MTLSRVTLGKIAFGWAIFLWCAGMVLPNLDSHTRAHPVVKVIIGVVYLMFLIWTPIALVAYFNRAWRLEFSAHPLLQPLKVDLSNADEFEFVLPEREMEGTDSELVKRVADEIVLARVAGKLVFSMTPLVDPFAGRLVQIPSKPAPKSDAVAVEPPIEPEER